MVSVNDVTIRFGGFTLFDQISFLINARDRIGLVGKNGAGKSSLLKLITGEMVPDEGSVSIPSDLTIGYLPQNMPVSNTRSVFEEAESAFGEVLDLERTMADLNHHLASRDDYQSPAYLDLIHQFTLATERYQIIGGANIHADVELTLKGLGFDPVDFGRPTSEFSGGWRMRVELAKILMRRPQLLLLDEPTNHLDILSIQWLEEFLANYPGAVLLISHDRAFLDQVTTRTIELSLGRSYDYKVPFSQFEILRKERREQQWNAFRNQQKLIEDSEEFIERFRYKATKAVQVQSRIKQLDKIERIEIDLEDQSQLRFRFPPAPHSGNLVVEALNLSKSYGTKVVFEGAGFVIHKGEKVALVGRNGEGKTTLSKILMGEIPYSGNLKIGHGVKIGYYAQNQDELLDGNKTVFQVIDDSARGEMRTKVRDLLGSFLFGGETIDKKVKVLSGGERSRLALAKLLLEPVNLLLLDEPTNHLDMASKDILKDALIKFDGTLIVVSHDRDFLKDLVSKVLEFRNGRVREHLGGIYEFLRKRKIENLAELNLRAAPAKRTEVEPTGQKIQYAQKKELDKQLRKAQSQVKKCEEIIEGIELEILQLDTLLAESHLIKDPSVFARYDQLKKQLDVEIQTWESAQEEFDDLEEKKKELLSGENG